MAHYRRRHHRRNPHSYHRRNPAVLGIELEDAGALAAGIWATKNVAAALGTIAAPVIAPINSLRAGLGQAAAELVSAWGVGRVVRMVRPRWAPMATLGGGGLAVSDAVHALVGSVDLIGGTPSLRFPGLSLPAPAAPNGAPALPPAQDLGVGSMGF